MKYVSIDIETTGLDPMENNILEFGAILDDLKNPIHISELPKFHCYILPPKNYYVGSPFAFNLNSEILKRIANKERPYSYISPDGLGDVFQLFLVNNGYELKDGYVKINVAGKNVASFDIPFLQFNCTNFLYRNNTGKIKINHRTIDPAILYFDPSIDNVLPDTKTCKERAGLKGIVSHTAIEDAEDVICLIRKKILGRI